MRQHSPFNSIIHFSCQRIEFIQPVNVETITIIVCDKYYFYTQYMNQKNALINQTQTIEVVNDKIQIEIPKVGHSIIDLNTYQAFSLEKVPIYDVKQLIGFLCFKIQQVDTQDMLHTIKQQTAKQQQQQLNIEDIKKNLENISQIYDEMSKEYNYQLQQELKFKKLEQEQIELNEIFNKLQEQEQILDEQFQKYQDQAPQLTILKNEKLQQQFQILSYQKKQQYNKVNQHIPFSFNEYFSQFQN